MITARKSAVARRAVALSHHVTWYLGRRCPEAIPLVFVLGFPKSGTTWACQLVADCLGLPFPQHSLFPIGFPAVVHGHEPLDSGYPRCVYVVRDGRDAMVSLFFHMARTGRLRVCEEEKPSDETVRRRMPDFLREQLVTPDSSPVSWAVHVSSFFEAAEPSCGLLRYESLLEADSTHLARAVEAVSDLHWESVAAARALERFSFLKQSRRPQGVEDRASFLRKGVAGDWRRFFNRDSAQVFVDHCGEMLIRAGYEKDRTWVGECEP